MPTGESVVPTGEAPVLVAVGQAIKQAVEGYKQVFGDRLAQVWLFGSRALGTHQPHSDVDLLVVLHEEEDLLTELRRICSVAEPIRLSSRVFIDGHPTTLQELENSNDDYHHFS